MFQFLRTRVLDLAGFLSVARSRSVLLFGVLWISIITRASTTETCVCLQNVISRLYNPIHVEFLPDSIYIAEQRGIVRYFGSRDKDGSTFLDITDKAYMTTNPADEQGLLGFTFHPRYNENSKVYMYYISNSSGIQHALVSEFTRGKDGAETTEKVLLKVEQISSRGNGGAIFFGHDGFLYISVGDGAGGSGASRNEAQDPKSLLGKILRIDVDNPEDGRNYGIPSDNPFVKNSPWRDEVFAYGCRNMWRCSQDMVADENGKRRIFCGDPGSSQYEEINIIRPGGNYGWDLKEGHTCLNTTNCGTNGTLENEELPVLSYKHTGVYMAVVGGYVYRGTRISGLYGSYVYGDAMTGEMSVLKYDHSEWVSSPLSVCPAVQCPCDARETLKAFILSFGQDAKGEVYVLTTQTFTALTDDGVALKLVPPAGKTSVTCAGCDKTHSVIMTTICFILSVSKLCQS